MRRTMILLLGALMLAAVGGLASGVFRNGTIARADAGGTPVEVGAFGCIVGQDGHRIVPAGSTIVIRNGWQSTKVGSVYSFLDAQLSVLSVNDGQMIDVSDQYTAPAPDPAFGWATWLRYRSGVTLANPGDAMRFTFTLVFDRPVTDTTDLDGDGSVDPVRGGRGLAFGGTCTVTAA